MSAEAIATTPDPRPDAFPAPLASAARFGAATLRYPDLFPARHAGEPWGGAEQTIVLPGATLRLDGLDDAQAEALAGHFAGFTTDPTSHTEPAGHRDTVEVSIFRAPPEDFHPWGRESFEYPLELDPQPHAVRVAGLGFMARFELPASAGPASRPAAAIWTCRSDATFTEVCENVLRIVTAYRLLAGGGVMLHSAAIVRDGRALLVPGCSAAGKSTLCALAAERGFRILSDELNAVVQRPGETAHFAVQQVPFAGDYGRAGRLAGPIPLAACCRLRHAERDALEPLSPAAALGLLWSTTPFVNRDPHRREALDACLADLVEAGLPARTLALTRDSELEVLGPLFAAGPT